MARFFLILGCNGKTDDNFISCNKTQNKILEITTDLEQLEELIAYFKSLRIFENPLKDYNAIRRVVFNLKDRYNKGKLLWNPKYFHLIEKFTLGHKECGMYLKIVKE